MRLQTFNTREELDKFIKEQTEYFEQGEVVREMHQKHGFTLVNNKQVHIKLKPGFSQKFKQIISDYPSTENEKYEDKYDLAYRMDIDNGGNGKIVFKIAYIHKGITTWIYLENFEDIFYNECFIIKTTRKVYDTEHVYFLGCSRREINDMRIRCLKFNTNNAISWYGGNTTLVDEELSQKIMNFVLEHY